MAAAVDYAFYSETYCGALGETAFREALPAAVRHVRWLCGGRKPGCNYLAYKRAICAAADAFAEYGEGGAGGFAIGDFRQTQYEGCSESGEDVATSAALKELVGTGLAFAGTR